MMVFRWVCGGFCGPGCSHRKGICIKSKLSSIVLQIFIECLQRLLGADEEAKNNIHKEIELLKKVSGHPNIIQFLTFHYTERAKTTHGQHEFLLITELCPGTVQVLLIYFII